MALACLVVGDRHHHLAIEILPALRAGKVVVCDLPSSLVLQRLDGLDSEAIWRLNDQTAADLRAAGWPVMAFDCTIRRPETIAWTIAILVLHTYRERSQA